MSLTLLVCIAAFIGVAALVGGVAIIVRGATDNVAEDRLGVLTGKTKAKGADKEATVGGHRQIGGQVEGDSRRAWNAR